MMRVLGVTGAPSGGKSRAVGMLLDEVNGQEPGAVRAARIDTGRIARSLASDHRTPDAAAALLDLGLMWPDQRAMVDRLQAELYAEELLGIKSAIVDGAPRMAVQVDAMVRMPRIELQILIVNPDCRRLAANAAQRYPVLVRAQPQREMLWYARLFHEVIESCFYHEVTFAVVPELMRGVEPMPRLIEWLKGGE